MKDAGTLLRTTAIICGIAFIAFVAASFLGDSQDRAMHQTSASAFIVGAVLSIAAGRSHSELVGRVARLERRIEESNRGG